MKIKHLAFVALKKYNRMTLEHHVVNTNMELSIFLEKKFFFFLAKIFLWFGMCLFTGVCSLWMYTMEMKVNGVSASAVILPFLCATVPFCSTVYFKFQAERWLYKLSSHPKSSFALIVTCSRVCPALEASYIPSQSFLPSFFYLLMWMWWKDNMSTLDVVT